MEKACTLELPKHLQSYTLSQEYEKYTALEHATWRYILRQQSKLLGKKAHKSYLQGLKDTGLCIDRIPRIENIDRHLQRFAWRAVCVRGFIPPLIFLEFQSRHIMPIARDMRTLQNVVYTSAPDIVHEAAGHAPFVARKDYRFFLEKYAVVATRAFFSQEDMELYEAIRKVSDMKENQDYTAADIKQAELELYECQNSIKWISEANKLSRFYWWTAEYGLVGSVKDYQIYGAGLLSSIFESFSCFDEKPKKVPLGLECVDTHYDITEPQPQLFVAENFDQLTDLLGAFEAKLAFCTGGLDAVETAKESRLNISLVLDDHLTFSGRFSDHGAYQNQVSYLLWEYVNKESEVATEKVESLGRYLMVLGSWKDVAKDPSLLTDEELAKLQAIKGKKFKLEFSHGVIFDGILTDWSRNKKGKLHSLSWENLSISLRQRGSQSFDYSSYEMFLGNKVSSVYPDYRKIKCKTSDNLVTTSPRRTSPFSNDEVTLFQLYQDLRDLRENKADLRQVAEVASNVAESYQKDHAHSWLLGVELVELAKKYYKEAWEDQDWIKDFVLPTLNKAEFSQEVKKLIKKGLSISHLDDLFEVS